MYNGIGLPTPRGSGTNGYVQRNLAHFKKSRQMRPDIVSKPDENIDKPPNLDIIAHKEKRKIEAKCLLFREELEEEGRSPEYIEKQIDVYRKRKLRELDEKIEYEKSIRETEKKDDKKS